MEDRSGQQVCLELAVHVDAKLASLLCRLKNGDHRLRQLSNKKLLSIRKRVVLGGVACQCAKNRPYVPTGKSLPKTPERRQYVVVERACGCLDFSRCGEVLDSGQKQAALIGPMSVDGGPSYVCPFGDIGDRYFMGTVVEEYIDAGGQDE